MSIDVATSIARILKEEGVEWVSTFPVCRVNNALGREGVPMIMMRDDRYAVALADAYSRVTGGDRIGVCTVQGGVNGAGLQYSFPGLAQAFEDNSPMLCITDGIPAGSTENTMFDVTTALKTVTKWFGYIDRPERTPEFMRRAFSMLRSGRPGPVVLAVPNSAGIYDETVDPYYTVRDYKAAPDPSDVVTAIDLLIDAANPLIYAGEGVIYAGASNELVSLAELLNAPVITTLKAKGAFPENHPLFVGVRGEHPIAYLNKSDVILTVGRQPVAGPVHPRHPQRAGEDHHPVQPGRAPHQPDLPHPPRGAGRRQVRPTGAGRRGVAAHRRRGSVRRQRGDRGPGDPGRRPGRVPRGDGLQRYAHQPVPRVRRHDEGAGPAQLFRDPRLRQHPRPAQYGVRHADPARVPGLGQYLHAGLRPGRSHGGQVGVPRAAVGSGHGRRRRGLHAGQPRGPGAAEPGHHRRPRGQRRVRAATAPGSGVMGTTPTPTA